MLSEAWVTASAGGECVQVRRDGANVLVRHSEQPDGPVISFTPGEWRRFIDGVRTTTIFDLAEWVVA
ncbi:DUF397 domain-containing protein [Nonomuraea sp. bgisy101]|uniref:DUF397 domain-containing protein n=1 Tax=Nonomuraea sp. bgisy101 TaxID=3413784 RepID=UPI003D74CE7B